MKLDHQLTSHIKINSRWVKDLNISHDIIKVLQENIGRKISEIPHSNIFTNTSSRARDIKERINKWDYFKLKIFCMAKEHISKIEREPAIRNTYLLIIAQTRFWCSKYKKNSHDSTPGRQAIQLKNGQRTWTDTSPQRTYRGLTDIWKDAQHHQPLERCKLKPQWDTTSHLSEWSLINQQTSAGHDVEKREPCTILVGMQTGAATVGNGMEFPQNLKMELPSIQWSHCWDYGLRILHQFKRTYVPQCS